MPNKKTKDDLLAEKVSAEKKLEQYSFWPEVQYLTKVEQYQIFEKLAQQADVNTAVQEAIDRYRAQQNGGK